MAFLLKYLIVLFCFILFISVSGLAITVARGDYDGELDDNEQKSINQEKKNPEE